MLVRENCFRPPKLGAQSPLMISSLKASHDLFVSHRPQIVVVFILFPTFHPKHLLFLYILVIHHCKTPFHHCTFSFITAHFVHHCTLKQAMRSCPPSFQAIDFGPPLQRRNKREILENILNCPLPNVSIDFHPSRVPGSAIVCVHDKYIQSPCRDFCGAFRSFQTLTLHYMDL